MSFDPALFEHIESSPNRTVSAAQAALHLGNQPVPQVRRKLIQLADASGGSIQVRYSSACELKFSSATSFREKSIPTGREFRVLKQFKRCKVSQNGIIFSPHANHVISQGYTVYLLFFSRCVFVRDTLFLYFLIYTNSHLFVQSSVNSPASTLVFVFPPDWRQRFNRKFWTARFKSILYQAGEIGFKVLRVAFGSSYNLISLTSTSRGF